MGEREEAAVIVRGFSMIVAGILGDCVGIRCGWRLFQAIFGENWLVNAAWWWPRGQKGGRGTGRNIVASGLGCFDRSGSSVRPGGSTSPTSRFPLLGWLTSAHHWPEEAKDRHP